MFEHVNICLTDARRWQREIWIVQEGAVGEEFLGLGHFDSWSKNQNPPRRHGDTETRRRTRHPFLNSYAFGFIRGPMILISVHQRKSAVKRILIFSVSSVPPW